MENDSISWLEQFYARLCNGDWEHTYEFKIANLDNPGWRIDFDLADTKLLTAPFPSVKEERSEHDWIQCVVKDGKFVGRGGPGNLNELLTIFRRWADTHIRPDESPWAD